MISFLVPQGLLLVPSCVLLARWVDLRTLRVVCVVGLFAELGVLALWARGGAAASSAAMCVSIVEQSSTSSWPLAFVFDDLAGMFLAVLLVALILCFAFLGEYFEYDLNAQSIVLLSCLFSQLATAFFCSADLVSLLAF